MRSEAVVFSLACFAACASSAGSGGGASWVCPDGWSCTEADASQDLAAADATSGQDSGADATADADTGPTCDEGCESNCQTLGWCWIHTDAGGNETCAPKSDADCAASTLCQTGARCWYFEGESGSPGMCGARSDAECASVDACNTHGYCILAPWAPVCAAVYQVSSYCKDKTGKTKLVPSVDGVCVE